MKQISMLLIIAALFQAAQAAPITVANASFEDPATANYVGTNGGDGTNGLPGWLHPAWTNTYLINKSGGTATATGVTGNQFLFLEPYNDGGNSYVYQNTGAKFAAGTYTLTVDVGMATGFADWSEDASAEFQLVAFDGTVYNYNLGVAATTVIVKNELGKLSSYSYTLDLGGSESFIGNDVVIVLKGNKNTSTFQNVSYDNVRLDAVPEPASLLLLGLGSLTLLRRRRASA
jgi:hypothetical protein